VYLDVENWFEVLEGDRITWMRRDYFKLQWICEHILGILPDRN
jgi:hypothetical protein